ncbi:MAG: ParB/RepB/Spo0J family partition protein [Bacteroidaceae bacterium]|nr:ParB/RepB/Spo0J family partition protein [Bacteroidaceae bacterium]
MQVRNIPLTDICPSNLNPRKTFDQESLNELAENIKENGLIQPITVRKLPKGSDHKFEIVCGERRYRAVTIAGMEEIPCVVRELDDKQAFAAMIIENLQRKDVDPMEEAAAFSKLYTDGTMKIAEIAKMLGKSSSFVTSRIQLNNIIPEFEALMRNGTLYLVHLLEICKLTQDQQKVLYENCFSEACIARWTQKILKLEILHEMIDEHVMNFLDTAQFSLADSSFACGKDCEGCPFNTKNKPESYKDSARPRCMNAVCFKQRVQEYIFRTAKALDIPIVYQGSKDDAIVQAAEAYGLKLTDMTNRSYVLCPKEPDRASFSDEEFYEKRMQAYRHVKAIFDSNIEDGCVVKVYEICYDGKLSGEFKYAYSIPADAETRNDVAESDSKHEQITRLKDAILKTNERETEELVEKKRSVVESSNYSSKNTALSGEEQRIFHAILLKRLSQNFKKSLGLEWQNTEDWFEKSAQIIEANRNAIKREFIKSVLGEKSVCFSHDLQGLLNALMAEAFASEEEEIKGEVSKKYESQRTRIQKEIDTLNGKEPASEQEETEESPEEQENE